MANPPKVPSNEFRKPTAVSSGDRAFRVWAMLGEMYGAAFMAKYGDSPGPLWRAEIAKLTDAELETGIARLMDAGGAFAPSLPEFKTACLHSDEPKIEQAEIEQLAYGLITSFDRQTLSRRDVEGLARRNLDRARALLTGEAQPRGSEANTLARCGFEPGKALVAQ